MGFVVAGITALILFLIVTDSINCVCLMKNENVDMDMSEKRNPIAIKLHLVKSLAVKEKLLIGFICICSILASCLIVNSTSDWLVGIRYWALLLVLVAVAIVDRYTSKIPNALSFFLLVLGVVFLVVEFFVYKTISVYIMFQSFLGAIGCLVLFYILARLTKDGIGMGDVKIIAAMGWMIGLESTIFSVIAALVLCSIISIILLSGKKRTKDESIPFGPFLFFGYIVMILLSCI